MDVGLFWRDNEIKERHDFRLLWTWVKNTNTFNPFVLPCILYMIWIQQQPPLSLEKWIGFFLFALFYYPWCVSSLQSVWRIALLFILLHLHISCSLSHIDKKNASIILEDDWIQAYRNVVASLEKYIKQILKLWALSTPHRTFSTHSSIQIPTYTQSATCLLFFRMHLSSHALWCSSLF